MANSTRRDTGGDSVRIGEHTVQAEGGVIHVRWVGPATLSDVRLIYDAIEGALDAQGRGLVLFDLRALSGGGAAQRRHAALWWQCHASSVALACYGLNAEVRVLRTLVARAIELTVEQAIPAANFATEADARAWLLDGKWKERDE